MENKFDYFYGEQAEQYTFYRIPRQLIKDKMFKALSCEAKLLYGLMLDRMSLSRKNKWRDEANRAYIIYSIEQIMDDLGCGKEKAVKVAAELDEKNGIGLIQRVKRGQGKTDIIYVKNFCTEDSGETEHAGYISGKIAEVGKTDFQKFKNQTSRSLKNGIQEVGKTDRNYNNINNTYMSETDNNNHLHPQNENSYQPLMEEDDDAVTRIRAYLKEKVEYDILVRGYRRENIDELISVMAECINSTADFIRINGMQIPQKQVRKLFENYDSSCMEYVLEALEQNTSRIKNVRAYLITALYNAPSTINTYYQAEANCDMHGT